MANLYPHYEPRPTSSNAERLFWLALREQLPDGWWAWHSLRLRVPQGRESEADFIVAIPGRGALLIEVKGGQISVRDGHWYQNGRPLTRTPRDQAHEFIGLLRAEFARCFEYIALPFIGIATAFIETAWENPPPHGDLQDAVIGKQDMPFLAAKLEAIAGQLLRPATLLQWPEFCQAMTRLWGDTWTPRLTIGTRTKLANEERMALDAEQRSLLDGIDDNPRLYVSGRPGTGKTILGMDIARRWKERGKKPIMICFTSALAASLRHAGYQTATVRELAADVLEGAGFVLHGGSPRASWPSEVWNGVCAAAVEALVRAPLPYDAVVVDEAQDLDESDWAFVHAVAEGHPMWVFGDEGQGFWPDRREIPAAARPFTRRLQKRYRCPKEVTAFADRYRIDAGAEPAPPVVAECLRVVRAQEPQLEEVCAMLIELFLEQGADPGDIAVLSLGGQSRARLGTATRIGEHPVARADDAEADRQIVADTFLRFKGLERPHVIVVELGLGQREYGVRMHIALTRAMDNAVVLATPEEIERDPNLKAYEELVPG